MMVDVLGRFRRARALATCALLSALTACGDDAQPVDTDGGDSCTGQGETYRVGMSKTSAAGSFTVELFDANPAPPAIGINAWKIRINDASGNPIANATVNINLYMPKHRHPQPGTVGTDKGGGAYDITDLNLVMPGLFDITVEVTAGGAPDEAKFQFCVSRKGD